MTSLIEIALANISENNLSLGVGRDAGMALPSSTSWCGQTGQAAHDVGDEGWVVWWAYEHIIQKLMLPQ